MVLAVPKVLPLVVFELFELVEMVVVVCRPALPGESLRPPATSLQRQERCSNKWSNGCVHRKFY